jgi:hypothetical protein
MKLILQKIFSCSYGRVTEVKQDFINAILEDYPDEREDVVEYRFIMVLAQDHDEPELAKLMNLYSVGWFIEPTLRYQMKQGDEYEIINSNYIHGMGELGYLPRVA